MLTFASAKTKEVMKAIPCKIVYYTYSGDVIDELYCNNISEAIHYAKDKRGNIHYYCYVIYDMESGAIIREGK